MKRFVGKVNTKGKGDDKDEYIAVPMVYEIIMTTSKRAITYKIHNTNIPTQHKIGGSTSVHALSNLVNLFTTCSHVHGQDSD